MGAFASVNTGVAAPHSVPKVGAEKVGELAMATVCVANEEVAKRDTGVHTAAAI